MNRRSFKAKAEVSMTFLFAVLSFVFGLNAPADTIVHAGLKIGNNDFPCHIDSNTDMRLTLQVVAFQNSTSPFSSGSVWGVSDAPPKLLVGHLAVSFNSKAVPLVISSYSDLGEPRDLSIQKKDGQVVVKLTGADAANSYLCQWFFSYSRPLDSYVLRKRIVQLNEFPEVNELTKFSYNERTDL